MDSIFEILKALIFMGGLFGVIVFGKRILGLFSDSSKHDSEKHEKRNEELKKEKEKRDEVIEKAPIDVQIDYFEEVKKRFEEENKNEN
jgi:hypothetical protein